MGGSSEEKNLPPSAKKLRDARQKGQVPKSKDLVSAAVTLAGFGFVVMQAGTVGERLTDLINTTADNVNKPLPEALGSLAPQIVTVLAYIITPLLGMLVFSAIIVSVIATGGPALSLEPLKPKPEVLNPAAGVKKLVSLRGLIEVIKSLFKLTVIAFIAVYVIRTAFQALVDLPRCGLDCSGFFLRKTLIPLAGGSVIVFLAFGLGDLLLQRWLFIRDQRMSLTEQKNERKNSEGNPQIRSAHRRERREAAQSRAGALNQATFVITGQGVAVAMRYSAVDTRVPMSIARVEGSEDVLDFVRTIRQLKLPIVHDPATARALFEKVEPGKRIPRELFQPVIDCMQRLNALDG